MNLANLETALTAWAERVSGLKLHWMRQSPKARQYPYISAELLAIRGKGHDEKLYEHDHVTDIQTLTLTGVRALTVALHFMSRSQKLGASARQLAEEFRTKIYSPSSLEELETNHLALSQMLNLVDTDFRDRSGRLVSQVTVDLQFEVRSSIVDTLHTSYVRKVDISSGSYAVDEYGRPVVDEDGGYVADEPGEAFTVSKEGRE